MVWKTKNVIEKVVKQNGSSHHIFNYYEVRKKLSNLFGEPKDTEEIELLMKRCKLCMDNMPVFILDKKMHDEYERRLRNAIKGNNILVSNLKAKLEKTQSTFQKKINKLTTTFNDNTQLGGEDEI